MNSLKFINNISNRYLEDSLENASTIITKNYLDKLETYEILQPTMEDTDIDISECGKFYKLTKFVINKEENFLNKLTTVVNVASSINCSISTIIKSDGKEIEYYLGIISKYDRLNNNNSINRRHANASAFKGAISGNFIGSDLEELSKLETEELNKNIHSGGDKCYSSVSGIVALRDEDNKSMEGYVQGIENLVDSLKGQKYTIIMIADPVSTSEIQIVKQGYEVLHTQLSAFARNTVTLNDSESLSLSKSTTEGIVKGISQGISLTQSKTNSIGRYSGSNVSGGVSLVFSASAGFSSGTNSSNSNTYGNTESSMKSEQKNKAVTDTTSSSKTSGKSIQMFYENRSVKTLLDKIDKHLKRLDECDSFGAFECAAYVIADNRDVALTVASNYNALMKGQNSNIQSSHINSWHNFDDVEKIGKYVSSFVHPKFRKNRESDIIVSPASIISGNELAIQIGLPKKSISGISVIPMASFGRNIINNNNNVLSLGKLYHMGHSDGIEDNDKRVGIDIESLSMHTFITGSTGKGKSTTIFTLLDKLVNEKVKGKNTNIKFMVIEPVKGEYKHRFGNYEDVYVYGTNYKKTPLLKINPFSFPDDIHILEHIDRLTEIFNVCWPMYAAMPAVLKEAIEKSYINSGWNLETSECKYKDEKGNSLFPSFLDVLRQINVVMDSSSYSNDSKGDYKGALCTRLKSLTNGIYGQIFTNDEIESELLFDENVIIDLSRVGSSEVKSLIMGLLVMKLQEYRMSTSTGMNEPLKHVTVLEEAHNILKRTSTEQSSETSNILGKSVEMLSNSIAEMRTYGEGFIISDQSPNLLDMSVIRNTNTKIILGLPDLRDRELVGRAANLNDAQILELSRLKTFVAAVYQNNWLEPVLCDVDRDFRNSVYKYEIIEKSSIDKMKYIEYLLLPINKRNRLDDKYVDKLIKDVYLLPIASDCKIAFMKYTKANTKEEVQSLRGKIMHSLFNSEYVFDNAKYKKDDIEVWYETVMENLEPNIQYLDTLDQKKIIAVLAKEQVKVESNKENVDLFEKLMNYI